MSKITLSTKKDHNITMIPNAFIDHYMSAASGSYVKVYLYLIRCLSDSSKEISVSAIADHLEETEKDIMRALLYWEKSSVCSISRDDANQIVSILFLPLDCGSKNDYEVSDSFVSEPESIPIAKVIVKPSYSDVQIEQLTGISEVSKLMNDLEQSLGRTLKSTDVQLVLYLYESLGFSSELILYLYEYCISKNKKNPSYIETVAIAWAEEGIRTIEEARLSSQGYQGIYLSISKAFGLNRAPGMIEQQYIERWSKEFRFSEALVTEACNRTLLTIGKPDFKYADKILDNWHHRGITDLNGVAASDLEHAKAASYNSENRKPITQNKSISNNKFNVFPQRKYSDDEFTSMEQRLLNRN